jgi:hypothetical protein
VKCRGTVLLPADDYLVKGNTVSCVSVQQGQIPLTEQRMVAHRTSCQTAGLRFLRRRSFSRDSSIRPLSMSALVISCGTLQLLCSSSELSSQYQLLSSSRASTTASETRRHWPQRSHWTQLSDDWEGKVPVLVVVASSRPQRGTEGVVTPIVLPAITMWSPIHKKCKMYHEI